MTPSLIKLVANITAIRTSWRWRSGFMGAAFAVLAGFLFWSTRLGDGLTQLSYDLLFLFKPALVPQEVVIVYIDEKSCRELKQDPKTWDRTNHVQLLNRLTADRARLVVFDIVFGEEREAKSDDALARAIKENGRVVLAAMEDVEIRPGIEVANLNKPIDKLAAAAAGWGIAALEPDAVKRRFVPIRKMGVNLAWAAAVLAGERAEGPVPGLGEERWLNYYGPPGTIRNVSFCEVKDQSPGFFRDKVVFVGGKPSTPHLFDQAEENQTPLTRWGDGYFPGVEIMATAFLNLYRGESLRRLSATPDLLLLALWGSVFGLMLGTFRSWIVLILATLGILAVMAVLTLMLARWQLWFPWALPFCVQWPCACLSAIACHGLRPRTDLVLTSDTAKGPRPAPLADDAKPAESTVRGPQPETVVGSDFDVFVCYKSQDFQLAEEVFHVLEQAGCRPFVADISLPRIGKTNFPQQIYRAMETARHMVVICSSSEKVGTPWVQSELSTFDSLLRSGRKQGNIVPLLCGGMAPNDLPVPLCSYATVSMSHDDWKKRLINFLR